MFLVSPRVIRAHGWLKDTDRGVEWSTYKTVKGYGEAVRSGLLHEDLCSYPLPESVGAEGYNDVRVGGG